MRLLLRLIAGIWLAALLVTGGFAYLEIQEDRERLPQDLARRASLLGDAVREAAEPLVARQARTGYDRVLKRFSRPDRAIVIYDEFGSVIAATPDVKPFLGPTSPLISQALRSPASVRQFQSIAGRSYLLHAVRLERDDKPIGAVAVFFDAQYLDAQEWQ